MRNGVAIVVFLTCLLGVTAAAPVAAGAAGPDLDSERWIAVFPGEVEPVLHEAAVPVWDREEGVVIAGPSEEQLEVLRAQEFNEMIPAGLPAEVRPHVAHKTGQITDAQTKEIIKTQLAAFAKFIVAHGAKR